ncbi:MAG: DUF2589 domain-containing protein [Bacteroidia bacterium]
MPAEKELVSMAQQFSGLPMDALIGAPLHAAANANAAMGLNQANFMMTTCFTKKEDTVKKETTYEPIMLKMELTRAALTPPTEDGGAVTVTEFKTVFNLPMLTIIPLNSLAVETVDISFEMEVKSSFSEEQSQEKTDTLKTEGSFEAKLGYGCFSASVKGSVSKDSTERNTNKSHYEKSNSAKYTVNVHAGQLPLPKGINIIIDAFSKAIEPITLAQTSQKAGEKPVK